MSSNQRRRRLRLIKTVEERNAMLYRSAASALSIASDTEAARLDLNLVRQRLLVECQARTSSRLQVEHPGAAPMIVQMDRPSLLIGSDPDCDIRLEHDDITARHAYLQWLDGHLYCCQIGARSSLFPERDGAASGRWLDHEPIPIGPFRLSLLDKDATALPDFSPLDRSPRLLTEYPQLGLQFEGVEQENNVWPVNRPLTMIGRGSQCKLRLNHKSMATVQACLLRTPKGCWLIDVVNNDTTRVNGRPVQIAPVDVGDVLELGPFQVEVVTMMFESIEQPVAPKPEKELKPIRFDRQPKPRPKSPDVTPAVAVAASPSDESTEAVTSDLPVERLHQLVAVGAAIETTSSTAEAAVAEPVVQAAVLAAVVQADVVQTVESTSAPLASIQTGHQPPSPIEVMDATVRQPAPRRDFAAGRPASSFTSRIRRRREVPAPDPVPVAPVSHDASIPVPPVPQPLPPEVPPVVTEMAAAIEPNVPADPSHSVARNQAVARDQPATGFVSSPEPTSDQPLPLESMTAINHADQLVEPLSTESSTTSPINEMATVDGAASATDAHQELHSMSTSTAHPEPAMSAAQSTQAALAQFIEQQQAQLAALKAQLDVLKQTYDTAAGQLISKKLRDTLEKPVIETMQCHESLQSSLDLFKQSVAR